MLFAMFSLIIELTIVSNIALVRIQILINRASSIKNFEARNFNNFTIIKFIIRKTIKSLLAIFNQI